MASAISRIVGVSSFLVLLLGTLSSPVIPKEVSARRSYGQACPGAGQITHDPKAGYNTTAPITLSASCRDDDGVARRSSLDIRQCLAYHDGTLTARAHGGLIGCVTCSFLRADVLICECAGDERGEDTSPWVRTSQFLDTRDGILCCNHVPEPICGGMAD
ncbi:hypothetical protein F4778DRAFT_788069 [Xylariomycetidae sp. FL2044]|nr:hypothetical protein F4778DRAFT_788069 [Xylariomycetidae sp. FL2044]